MDQDYLYGIIDDSVRRETSCIITGTFYPRKNRLYGFVDKSVRRSYSLSCCATGQVGGSNPGRSCIAEGIFHPTRQLATFSPPNMSSIVNSNCI